MPGATVIPPLATIDVNVTIPSSSPPPPPPPRQYYPEYKMN